jgi:hypothetical protein
LLQASRFLLLVAFAGAACVGDMERKGPAERAPATGVAPAHRSIFAALAGAIEDGDQGMGQALLVRLRLFALSADEERFAKGFEQVLVGRDLVSRLELGLSSEPRGESGRYRLVLTIENLGREELRLHLPPADLSRFRLAVDPEGTERSEYDTRVLRVLSDLELAPRARRELDLFDYTLPIGRFLAVRERWQLYARSGEIYRNDQCFPAANIQIAPCERMRLCELSAEKPVSPEELARLFGAESALETAVLLEHAVRVLPEHTDSAIRGVAPHVERWARTDPERIQSAAPALRWLTHNTQLGGEALAWNQYLKARLKAVEKRAVLDLPPVTPPIPGPISGRDSLYLP